jgi:hypothetical protein
VRFLLPVFAAAVVGACAGNGPSPRVPDDKAPVANIIEPALSTTTIWAGDAVSFVGTCSDPDGDAVAHQWDISGVPPQVLASAATGPVVFQRPGTFTVRYHCTDASGASSEVASREVIVGPADTMHWYVDANRGDDTGDGLAPSRPLRTIATLRSKAPPPGATIYLARGSKWHEEISGLSTSVSILAYGPGARPVLDASDPASNADFRKTDGRSNVYEITWAHELDAPGKVKHSAWQDGSRLVRVADVATCDSTPGAFYAPPPDTINRVDTLFVHPRGSTDPRTDGALYEFARRKYGITGLGQPLTVSGVVTRRNGHNDGSLRATYAEDCICEDGTTHNCWNDGLFVDVTAWKAEGGGGAGSWTMFVHYTNGSGPGAEYRRCRAIGSSAAGGVGFYSHTAAGVHDSMTYTDCVAYNLDSGFGGGNAESISITNGRTYQVGRAITAVATNLSIQGGIYNGWTREPPVMSRWYAPATAAGTVTVRDTVVVARTTSGALIYGTMPAVLDVQRSTFAFGDLTGYPWVDISGGTTTLVLNRNVFASAWDKFLNMTGTTTLLADSNVYGNGAGFTISGVSFWTFAAYQAAVAPQEAASLCVDPELIGSVQWGDVRVSASSRARALGAGAQLDAPTPITKQYWDSLLLVTTAP